MTIILLQPAQEKRPFVLKKRKDLWWQEPKGMWKKLLKKSKTIKKIKKKKIHSLSFSIFFYRSWHIVRDSNDFLFLKAHLFILRERE